MNQNERRRFLIQELLQEDMRYQDMRIPVESEEQKQLLRGLMNIRLPRRINREFLSIQDEYLKEEIAVDTVKRFMQKKTSVSKVIFNVFKDLDKEIYRRLL